MKLLLALSLVMIVTKGFTQDVTPGNCQLASVLQIDGHAEEWPMTWIDDSDKKFSYNVCTDDNNIYVRMKTKDEIARRKIGLFGFTLWMDGNGKKKKKLGLKFPTGAEAQERMEARRESGEHINFNKMTGAERAEFQKEMNKSLIADLELLELIGLADDPLTSTRSGITNGIKVAIATDDEGTYVYEAIIPFKSFRLSKASIPTLGIGFETGKFIPPPMKAPAGSGGTGPGQGGQRGGGGRGYGGGGYGGSSGMGRGQGYQGSRGGNPEMSSSTSLWVSIKLK